ncbi:MAG: GspH/FimT family pseudopilin [Candidatus Krumholzibacteria bacterium]|nr:GspH/FimT family pseudopilin [Candidatus Krumholzibacteria bacterium]
MKRTGRIRANAGFTLTETMIIVVIIGVIAGLTIPSFMNYLQRQKVEGARNSLMADIAYARSLAIARRTTLRMVFTDDAYTIIEPGPDTVMRTKAAPAGVIFAADVNPNFYAHGLADAANIALTGARSSSAITLLPNGTATHD